MAYPDMGDVRNNVKASVEVTAVRRSAGDNPDAEAWESAIQSASITDYRGSGGNPFVQPMESTQYDMSLEWSFAPRAL